MKIIHTADWHLGKKTEGKERLSEQKTAMENLIKLTEQQNADAVFVCGDIYDTFLPSSDAEDLFYSVVSELSAGGRRLVVVIAGNHDDPVRLCAASPIALKNSIIIGGGLSNTYNGFKSKTFELKNGGGSFAEFQYKDQRVVLNMLPYPSDARLKEFVSELSYSQKIDSYLRQGNAEFSKDKINFTLGHIFSAGAQNVGDEREIEVGGLKICTTEVFSPLCHYTALGHIHKKQKIGNSIYYSGSLLKYSADDTNKKGVMICEADSFGVKNLDFAEISGGKDIIKYRALSVGEAELLLKGTEDYVQLTIAQDAPIEHSQYKALNSNKNLLSITLETLTSSQYRAEIAGRNKKSKSEIFVDYYKSKYNTEPSKQLLSLFVELAESI